jgi:hypothetical protein
METCKNVNKTHLQTCNALVVPFSVYIIFSQFSTTNIYTFKFNLSKLTHIWVECIKFRQLQPTAIRMKCSHFIHYSDNKLKTLPLASKDFKYC